jgi:hypothetical protein
MTREGIDDAQLCIPDRGKNFIYLLSSFRKHKNNWQEHNPSAVENKSDDKIIFKLQGSPYVESGRFSGMMNRNF